MALTHLDVSHNLLTALPPNLYALPHLVHLNVSHNALSALPFSTPFTSADGTPQTLFMGAHDRRDPFAPVLSRASKPLPALVRLEASNNCLSAASIDAAALPRAVTYIDLSHNPLGANFEGLDLISAFAALPHLSEAHLAHTALTDDAFPPPSSLDPFFPTLTLLDVSSAPCTAAKLVAFLHPAKREIDAQPTATPPRPGTIRLLVGTSVVKESWEVEAERRTTARRAAQARAAEALVAARAEETETSGAFGEPPRSPQKAKSAAATEAWELEAEAGLMTAAGRRRARAAAAAAANGDAAPPSAPPSPTKPSAEDVEPPTHLLSFSQYYDASSRSLSLPATRAAPGRPLQADTRLPRTALPLALITASPIGATLKVLALSGRRADPSVTLPDEPVPPEGLLPQLDTLLLDDCRLADTVPGSAEPLLELLVRLFPRLQTLDLAHNVLTSASLTASALSALILASPPDEDGIIARPGLRTLRLRGNAFDSLDGLAELAGDLFRGHRVEPGWHLEEIDVRDNALAKLPAELGMLPLDVFLVEGNTFRIPQRRVWEREGTKGLLAWLRGRME
jgi:Leucine-rich repeat (LRR) protein